jgi:phage/plasmid-associated DNA primase
MSANSEFIDSAKKRTDSKLAAFLEQYRATDPDGNPVGKNTKPRPVNQDTEILITSVLPVKGKYYVPKKKTTEMCRHIYSDIVNRSAFYATEKPDKDDSPFRVDIDLKSIVRAKTEKKLSLQDIYTKIYDYFVNFIQKNFETTQENLVCYVLTKRDVRRKEKEDEDQQLLGVHLHFPFARGTSIQLKKIREMASYVATTEGIFPNGFIAEKYIDSIETTVWTLYGSVKDNMAYRVTHVLSRKPGKSTKIKKFSIIGDSEETVKLLLLYNGTKQPLLQPTKAFEELMEEEYKNEEIKKSQWKKDMNSTEYNHVELEKASQLCTMLSPARVDCYNSRRSLGLVLHSISHGHEDGFKLWELTVERLNPEAFSDSECNAKMRNIWGWASGLESTPWNMGSLRFWAESDSPQEFNEWRKSTNRSQTEMAVKIFNEGALAELAFELYGKEYQYTTNDHWYKFFNEFGHWKKDPYSKAKWIRGVFMYDLKAYLKDYIKNEEHLSDAYKKLENLGKCSLLNNCVSMAALKFSTDEKFEEQLDQNPYLIGDQNGVYDLQNGVHRKGTPEDYISLKMGANYRDYTWDHPDVKSVMRFWAKIHVDPVIRKFFLKAIAVCMIAGNKEKMILVMTNDNGDAGKSACLKIIEKIWNDYAITLSRDRFIVSSYKTAGGPAPDIANARNKRLGSVKELSKDETLDIGALKLFSGSDDVQVRTLYDKGGDMQILLTMILMMNKLPPIPAGDKPTWNRLRVIPFESIFDDDAPSDEKEQWRRKHFKPDRDIKAKLAKLKDAFYWVFLQYFKIYQSEGLLPLPEKVKVATQNYRESNDLLEQYLYQSLEFTHHTGDQVYIAETFYKEYLEYHRINCSGKSMIVPPKFVDFKKTIVTYFLNKKTKIGETAKGDKFFKYIQNPSLPTPIIHGVKMRELEGEIIDREEEVDDEEEDEAFYKEKIELGKDVMDEEDFEEFFKGPTFIGLEESEMSRVE